MLAWEWVFFFLDNTYYSRRNTEQGLPLLTSLSFAISSFTSAPCFYMTFYTRNFPQFKNFSLKNLLGNTYVCIQWSLTVDTCDLQQQTQETVSFQKSESVVCDAPCNIWHLFLIWKDHVYLYAYKLLLTSIKASISEPPMSLRLRSFLFFFPFRPSLTPCVLPPEKNTHDLDSAVC